MVKSVKNYCLLRLIGVEPTTSGTEIQRSVQLSYKRKNKINYDTTTNYFKSC
jgi:hypothetical protein